MNYPLALPSYSAPEVTVQCESVSPHLNRENMTRIQKILAWIPRAIEAACGPYVRAVVKGQIRKLGYLSLVGQVQDERFRGRVEEVLKAAMRASNGCCDCCDQPGDVILESGWLTTLCESCAEAQALEEIEIDTRTKERIYVIA